MPSPLPSEDEFYINYRPLPKSYGRFLIKFIASLLLGVLIFAWVLPKIHNQFNLGRLYGRKDLEGFLAAEPVPHLVVPRPGKTETEQQFSRYLLTGTGKTAPKPKVLEHLGQWVKLNGIVVSRNQLSVIAARTSETIPTPTSKAMIPPEGIPLGSYSLSGEILDSKCYPGVMKPGQGKAHRACAIRCIAGGVPPVLRVQNQKNETLYFLLADTQGKAVNEQVLERVGEPVQIQGDVVQYNDMFVLKADPKDYQSL